MSILHGRNRPEEAAGPPRPGLTLLVVCCATFMLTLDVTIVSVALSRIQTDLHASLSALQWVVDAYTLTLAGGLLSAAVLGDRIGRLRLFVAGLLVFTAASLMSALSSNVLQLNLARAAQGIGAAILFGTALPLLGAAYPDPRRRARAIGAFGASYAAATAVGPLVGGGLVDGLGWRWIFLINLPIGLLTLTGCRWLQESRPARAPGNDWVGTGLLTGCLLTLLLALIRGNANGWSSPQILGLFTGSALLLAGFVAWEQHHPEPMLSLRLFTRPAFAGVALQSFATGATLVAATYYLALDLQNVAGLSPIDAGIRFLPLTMIAFVAAPVTAALLHRTGTTPPLIAGLALSGIGLLSLARLDTTASLPVLVPGFIAGGAGLGIGAAAVASAALAAVDPADAGMATGAVNTLRQVGVSAGVAGLGALLQHETTRKAATHLAALPPGTLNASARERLTSEISAGLGHQVTSTVPPALRNQIGSITATATTSAVSTLLAVAGSFALAAAIVCAVLLTRNRPPTTEPTSGRPTTDTKQDAPTLAANRPSASLAGQHILNHDVRQDQRRDWVVHHQSPFSYPPRWPPR